MKRVQVFKNWDTAARFVEFPEDDRFPAASPRAGDDILDFIDMGEVRRAQLLRDHEPDTGSPVGRYDVVCHSMGSLDMCAALVTIDDARPITSGTEIARAYNFIAVDSPFRGVPNIDAKRELCDNAGQKSRCLAMMLDAAQLQWIDARRHGRDVAEEHDPHVARLESWDANRARLLRTVSRAFGVTSMAMEMAARGDTLTEPLVSFAAADYIRTNNR